MKITPITEQITLNPEDHSYSWKSKDSNILSFSVSEIIHGKREFAPTKQMQHGSKIHLAIQEYIESGTLEEPATAIAHYIEVVRIFKDTQLGACEKSYASLIEVDDTKIYLCGTPDLIIDDTLFEFKSGGVYAYNKDQVDLYHLLTNCKFSVLIHGDCFTKYFNYPLTHSRTDELTDKIKARLSSHLTDQVNATELENADLVALYHQKEELKAHLKILDREMDIFTNDFGVKTIVSGILKFTRHSIIRKKIDAALVGKELPEAISFTTYTVQKTSLIGN